MRVLSPFFSSRALGATVLAVFFAAALPHYGCGAGGNSKGRNARPKAADKTVTTDEDNAVSFILEGADPEGAAITFAVQTHVTDGVLECDTAGACTYTPNPNFNGSDAFTFTTHDGISDSAEATVVITVTSINDAPLLAGTPLTSIDEDQLYSFDAMGDDADLDNLVYSLKNKPGWMFVDILTGVVSGTPRNADVGATSGVLVCASDGLAPEVCLGPFDVTVNNVNDAPTLAGIPSAVATEDAVYTSNSIVGSDIDAGDSITFSVSGPAWLSINTTNGALAGIPRNEDVGSNAFTVTATDTANATGTLSFTINVKNTNDAPTLQGTPVTTATVGEPYTFTVVGNDVDAGATLIYSINQNPPWMSIDTSTGVVSGVPGIGDVGTSMGVAVCVSDGAASTCLPVFNVTVDGSGLFTVVDAGLGFSVGLKAEGSLWTWGKNDKGQLGDGAVVDAATPTQRQAADSWVAIAAGNAHVLAIRADGTLWSWGFNALGQLGAAAGDTCTVNAVDYSCALSPLQIGTQNTWTAVAAGMNHSLALRDDGSLWAWGDNQAGQLGTASADTCTVPVLGDFACAQAPTQVGSGKTWTQISAGDAHSIALQSDGSLWTWGDNTYGQLGDGCTATCSGQMAPTSVGSANDWRQISAGASHNLAVKTTGALWSWGRNDNGQLGHSLATTTAPTQVGSAADWLVVNAGYSHSIGIRAPGNLWAWGDNSLGRLGSGDTVDLTQPTQIDNTATWAMIVGGGDHSVALQHDGSLWAWGHNDHGQLGLATTDLCTGSPCATAPLQLP